MGDKIKGTEIIKNQLWLEFGRGKKARFLNVPKEGFNYDVSELIGMTVIEAFNYHNQNKKK